jgi:hypothetical protein
VRIGAAVLGGLLVATLAAGCAASPDVTVSASGPATTGESSPVARRLQAASERTLAEQTGRFELEVSAEGFPPGLDGRTTARGEFDGPHRRVHVTTDVEAVPPVAGALAPMEVIVDGATSYLRLPVPGPDDRAWLRLEMPPGLPLAPAPALPVIDEAWVLETLRGLGPVTEVGPEEVRGVPTTRYDAAGTIDVPMPGTWVGAAPESLAVSAWIDGEGLLRRLVVTTTGAMATNLRLELFDLGTPVAIELPPAEQIADFADLGGLVPAWPGTPECAPAGTVPPCSKGDHID